MNSFVTGGSGFVGGRLVETLDERDEAVFALARSDESARTVEAAGAEPVRGDLSDVEAMADGMADCDVVFHAAAKVDEWGDPETFEAVNVDGTDKAIEAARRAGVDRFVHVSTEAVLVDGSPLRNVDETHPIPDDPVGYYPRTKAEAEKRVTAANGPDLTTCIVRPRFVWGAGDTTLLPELVAATRSGRLRWFDGGRYPTSTTHVDNVVEGLLCAAEHGEGGETYFVTDGEPVEFRSFVSALLETQGVEPPDGEVPKWMAWWGATVAEVAWRHLPLSGSPPLTRMTVGTIGHEVTIDDGKARREIGYEGRVPREAGLEELREADTVL